MRRKTSRFGENEGELHKCSICGEEYTIHDTKNPNKDTKNGKIFRFPNEWTESEIEAHRISHIESPKARRILGGIDKLSDSDREQVLSFINDHYDG